METAFNPEKTIKSMTCALASVAWPACLIVLIAALTGVLTYEAGQFFGGLGWGKALLVEVVALSLIAYRPGSLSVWLAKCIVLAGAFSMVVYGAAYHAARPHMEADAMKAVDKIRLESLNESIAGYRASLEAVDGQPRNSAIAARKLRDAIAEKDEFVRGMETDKLKTVANNLAVLTAVAFRIILQLGNWLLMHRLVAAFAARDPRIQAAPNPEAKTLPQPEQQPLASAVKWDSETLKILSKIDQSGGQIKRLQLQQARIADTAGLDPRLNQLLEAGVISQERNGKMTETIYRLQNG